MDPRAQLASLKLEFPVKELPVAGGRTMRYVNGGAGPDTVLVLPAATGRAESSVFLIGEFAKFARVVAISYPPVDTMRELCTVIAETLQTLSIARVHVFGGSYGGLVAQCFAREYPDRVQSLVLSHTGIADCRKVYGFKIVLPVLRLLPFGLVTRMMQVKFAPLLRNTTEREFWTWFLKDEFARVGKRDLLAAFARVCDLHQHYEFTAENAPAVPTLILESAQEEMLRPEERARMKACYLRALVYTFENAGHAVAITHREAYVATIRAFIDGNREHGASA